MRWFLLLLPLMALLPSAHAGLFSAAERADAVRFWNGPGRYSVQARPEVARSGPWVVRLTPAASRWFMAYNRARGVGKAPPTEIPGANSAQTAEWEKWVLAKLGYDRQMAQFAVDAANAQGGIPSPQAVMTQTAPVPPGPIPPDLLAAAGNPPPFAAAVAPLHYTITFDADHVISYTDHIGVNPRYAYYRFDQGVQSLGVRLSNMSDRELDALFAESGMTPFEQHVAKSVSKLEGGFDSVNTYDTGYLSVGFIQFATLGDGSGSLGEVLLREKQDRPAEFQEDFRAYGIDVNTAGAIVVVDPATGAELAGPEAVLKVIDEPRLVAVFQLAGIRSHAFRIAQIMVAKAHYYPADNPLKVAVNGHILTGKVGDVIKSEAGMATLFDRKVNTGSTSVLAGAVANVMEAHHLTRLEGTAPYERDIVQSIRYRTDFLADKNLRQPR